MAKPRYQGKELTKHLQLLAMEAEGLTDDGETITKAALLAIVLWKKALGWTENKKMDDGKMKDVFHTPEAWAIQLIYDRLEGRVAQTVQDTGDKLRVADRVSELTKRRVNAMAAEAVDIAPLKPPKIPEKLTNGDT